MALAPLLPPLSGCGGGGSAGIAAPATRSWKMGFFPTPPRPDTTIALQGIDRFSERAELLWVQQELPWTDLLAGMTPDAILDRDSVPLVNYCRAKGLRLGFMAELNDGLSRAEEAPQLRALGRSIAEASVQQVYRQYVLAVAAKLQPDVIGVAAETNLVRAAAAPALYAALVKAANDCAIDLRMANVSAPIFVTVQAETAWGVLGSSLPYAGVDVDFADFPFTQMLGISSYPYFGYAQPEDIPGNYYSRLLNGRSLPVLVTEGGWTSAGVGSTPASPDAQARYLRKQGDLLDSVSAEGVVQTLFADIDLSSIPPPVPPTLPAFAAIGLTGSDFAAKPALAVWDGLFARRLQ
jgi:hypothetical protein